MRYRYSGTGFVKIEAEAEYRKADRPAPAQPTRKHATLPIAFESGI
jgi:hypothetical protein